jgi:hypothetical protein
MKKVVPFLLLILLFAGAAWFSLKKPADPVHELPPPVAAPASIATQEPSPAQPDNTVVYPEPESVPVTPPVPLPVLGESDPEVKRELGEIAGVDPLTQYLITDNVISRVVASIDSLTSRQVPVHINPIRPAEDTFLVDKEGESVVLSKQNFARYDGYVDLVQSMDTDSLMTFYRRYYPLFQQAWEQNGGLGSFDNRMLEVIDDLLETPDVPGPIYLTKPEAVYLFEDPELESMTAGQKVLVRMGSANAAVVKEKLAEIKERLNPQGG